MILPGATLGLLGGGQLGLMFTVAARTMGYRVIVHDPDADSPAAMFANEHICAPLDDRTALNRLGRACAAITTEFENIPADSLSYLAQLCPVRPGACAVAVAQDRILEKRFLCDNGFETARFAEVRSHTGLEAALQKIGTPALLKASRFGYDGKSQGAVDSPEDAFAVFDQLGGQPCVLEERLHLVTEISVVVARGTDGKTVAYPAAENRHKRGILNISIVPAQVTPGLAGRASAAARAIAGKLDYCGVLAVEFFVLENGHLVINEIAPRPHNSGHYTLDACITSQFEQQVRAMCGLPLGDTRLLAPAVMVNLLGDLWREGVQPPWAAVLNEPQTKLHLYGKHEARPGRKMGHYTCLGDSVEAALKRAHAIQESMKQASGSAFHTG